MIYLCKTIIFVEESSKGWSRSSDHSPNVKLPKDIIPTDFFPKDIILKTLYLKDIIPKDIIPINHS